MLERCPSSFSHGWHMILLVVLFLVMTSCTTLQPPEEKAAFSPPDIDRAAALSAKTPLLLGNTTGLALAEGVSPPVRAGGNGDGGAEISSAGPSDGLGIKISGIQWSAAGYMLYFRYTVINPADAQPMFDRSVIPYLVHEKSGARFAVPNPAKIGPLRTTGVPETGRIYHTMFANPGRYVQQGDLVTVVVGEHRFEHLTVK